MNTFLYNHEVFVAKRIIIFQVFFQIIFFLNLFSEILNKYFNFQKLFFGSYVLRNSDLPLFVVAGGT